MTLLLLIAENWKTWNKIIFPISDVITESAKQFHSAIRVHYNSSEGPMNLN